MSEYTIEAIAVKCSRSARQVTRWLSSGKLPATRIEGTNKYSVSDEALVPFLPSEAIDDLLDRIMALEMALSSIFEQIAVLSSGVASLEAMLSDRPIQQPPPAEKRPGVRAPAANGLPDGDVPLLVFARQHGMNKSSVMYQLSHGIIHVTGRPHPARPGQQEYFVTPSQMEQVIIRWQGNENFVPCEQCPHQT